MRKIVLFFMMIFGINAMAHIGLPCSISEKKCVIRGFKIDGNVPNEGEASTIREIVDDLNKYGESGTIDVIGHTDSTGSQKHNLKLSKTRAKNFARLMREFGLDKRFSFGEITGKGEDSPVDTNETVEGRYNNRRVEIILNNIEYIPPKFIE